MGIFTKTTQYIKEHLGKTRDKISSSLTSIISLGRNIDDELLDELEQTLISDDIGVETTDKLFVVKNVPKEPDTVEFGHYNVSIDTKTHVPMKMDFYDKKGQLYKTIESTKIETIQGFPTVVKSVVSNLQTGSKTEMEFSKVKYDINLKDSIFTERYLRRPPREAIR